MTVRIKALRDRRSGIRKDRGSFPGVFYFWDYLLAIHVLVISVHQDSKSSGSGLSEPSSS